MKKCITCGVEKTKADFYSAGRKCLKRTCIVCNLAIRKARRLAILESEEGTPRSLERHVKNKESSLKRFFAGCTGVQALEQYAALCAARKDLCDICGKPEVVVGKGGLRKSLGIDFDPAHKRIKGLICTRCSFMLGYAGREENVLLQAAAYLQKASKG